MRNGSLADWRGAVRVGADWPSRSVRVVQDETERVGGSDTELDEQRGQLVGELAGEESERPHPRGEPVSRRRVQVRAPAGGLGGIAGASVGIVLALLTTRLLQRVLFEVSPLDLPTFAAMALFLARIPVEPCHD